MQGPSCKVYQMQEQMENAQFNSQDKFTEKKKIIISLQSAAA